MMNALENAILRNKGRCPPPPDLVSVLLGSTLWAIQSDTGRGVWVARVTIPPDMCDDISDGLWQSPQGYELPPVLICYSSRPAATRSRRVFVDPSRLSEFPAIAVLKQGYHDGATVCLNPESDWSRTFRPAELGRIVGVPCGSMEA